MVFVAAIFQNQGPIVRQSTRHTAPYLIRDLVPLAEGIANTGRKVHWLNIGDPGRFGFKPPQEVSAAVEEAARARAHTGYAPSQGDPELVKLLAKREGVPESRILVTAGLSEGISFLFRALVDLGEHILLPSPGYPLYNTKLRVSGGTDNYYQTDKDFMPVSISLRHTATAIFAISAGLRNELHSTMLPKSTLG